MSPLSQEAMRRELEALRDELEETRKALSALMRNEVDAVAIQGATSPTMVRAAQDALRESRHVLRAVFDNAMDAMLLADDEGRYVDANPAACELFGLPRAELLGRCVTEFGQDEADTAHQWAAFRESGAIRGEFELHRPDGTVRITEFAARADVTPGLHLSTLRDVTEQRQLEERLLHSQKMEAVGRMAGGIAHDFNNLLTVIGGCAHNLSASLDDSADVRAEAVELRRAVASAARLTAQLLTFSRHRATTREVVDVAGLIRDLEAMLERILPEDLGLRLEIDDDLWLVAADSSQLEQVIVNLAINARDAMSTGDTLTIRAGNVTVGDRHLLGAPGEYVAVEVEDTGLGMPPEVRKRVFEPFFTTKPEGKGTGLGLSTAYGIVSRFGGWMEVESEPGEGTRFSFLLPRASLDVDGPAEPEEAPAREKPERRVEGLTVLVAEDEPALRRLVTKTLRRAGYRVLEASNGMEALEVATTERGTIDLLISDLVMPRMNGFELAKQLAVTRPTARVLFTSGYADERALPEGLEQVGFEVLDKPFDIQDLVDKVRDILAATA